MQFESDPALVDGFVMTCLNLTEEMLTHARHNTPMPSTVNRLAHVWANICAVFPGFRRFQIDWQLLRTGQGELDRKRRELRDKARERLRRLLLCVVYGTATFGVQSDAEYKRVTQGILHFKGMWCENMYNRIYTTRWDLAHIADVADSFVVDCEFTDAAMAERVKAAIVNGTPFLDQGDEGRCVFGKPLMLKDGDSWGIDHAYDKETGQHVLSAQAYLDGMNALMRDVRRLERMMQQREQDADAALSSQSTTAASQSTARPARKARPARSAPPAAAFRAAYDNLDLGPLGNITESQEQEWLGRQTEQDEEALADPVLVGEQEAKYIGLRAVDVRVFMHDFGGALTRARLLDYYMGAPPPVDQLFWQKPVTPKARNEIETRCARGFYALHSLFIDLLCVFHSAMPDSVTDADRDTILATLCQILAAPRADAEDDETATLLAIMLGLTDEHRLRGVDMSPLAHMCIAEKEMSDIENGTGIPMDYNFTTEGIKNVSGENDSIANAYILLRTHVLSIVARMHEQEGNLAEPYCAMVSNVLMFLCGPGHSLVGAAVDQECEFHDEARRFWHGCFPKSDKTAHGHVVELAILGDTDMITACPVVLQVLFRVNTVLTQLFDTEVRGGVERLQFLAKINKATMLGSQAISAWRYTTSQSQRSPSLDDREQCAVLDAGDKAIDDVLDDALEGNEVDAQRRVAATVMLYLTIGFERIRLNRSSSAPFDQRRARLFVDDRTAVIDDYVVAVSPTAAGASLSPQEQYAYLTMPIVQFNSRLCGEQALPTSFASAVLETLVVPNVTPKLRGPALRAPTAAPASAGKERAGDSDAEEASEADDEAAGGEAAGGEAAGGEAAGGEGPARVDAEDAAGGEDAASGNAQSAAARAPRKKRKADTTARRSPRKALKLNKAPRKALATNAGRRGQKQTTNAGSRNR